MNDLKTFQEENIIKYIFSNFRCIHPFKISRLLLLAEWSYGDKYGSLLTELTYITKEYGFYVEEIPKIVDRLTEEGCLEKDEVNKCFKYICNPPHIEKDVKDILDEVIHDFGGLSDKELNRIVIEDKKYRIMLKR